MWNKSYGSNKKSISGLTISVLRLVIITPLVNYGREGLADIANGCPPSPLLTYWTDSTITGQLTITHFDQQKQIVSGTFYFDAVDATSGDTVHVTDGRFDMIYTQ